MLAAVQQLAEAGALKKWGVVETPPRRNVLQGKPVIVHLPFAAALISVAELGTPTRSTSPLLHPHPIATGELRMVGISQPEKIATISVRNDAAFLFSVVGTTSIAAVVSVATQSRCWAGRLGWAEWMGA